MKQKKKTTKKTAKKKAIRKTAGKFMGHEIYVDEAMNADWGVIGRTPFSSAVDFAHTNSVAKPFTLDSDTLNDAMDALMLNMNGQRWTIIERMAKQTGARDAEEVLEIMFAMIQAFHIQTRPGPARYGEQVTLSMELPLGRHTQRMNTMNTVMRRSNNDEHARMDRHYTYVEMFTKMLEPVRKWIDIAERAKNDMTFKEILALENIEQRRAALRIFGEERLIEESGAILLDTGTHNQQLYVIPESVGAFDTAAFYLKYNCPSTGRLYVSGVAPDLFVNTRFRVRPMNWPHDPRADLEWRGKNHTGWADKAMAWKFHMTPEEYARMRPENQA